MLPDATDSYYTWSFRFKLITIKYNLKFYSSVSLATFQVVSSYMGLVATILDSAHIKHFHHRRKFYWTKLTYDIQISERKGEKTTRNSISQRKLPLTFWSGYFQFALWVGIIYILFFLKTS